MAEKNWWRRRRKAALTLVSGLIMLVSFVARDQILSGTQDALRGLDAAETTISVRTNLSSIFLGVLTTVNIVSHNISQQCTDRATEQIKTVGDGRAEATCVLETYVGTNPVLDTFVSAARAMPENNERTGMIEKVTQIRDGLGKKAQELEDTMQKDTGKDTALLDPKIAGELTKTYKDISTYEDIVLAGLIQKEREDIQSLRKALARKARWATLLTDGLFLLGWIITVGAKPEGVEGVVGG